VWVLKCAPRSTKKGNNFGQLEHLKLKGLKIKTISVFCRDQSIFRESYYGTKPNSNGTEHLSNGTEHHSNDRTLTTAAANSTAAARTKAAHGTTSKSQRYRGITTELLCTSRKLQYCVTCVKKKCAERTKPFTPRKCLNLRLCAHGRKCNLFCRSVPVI